MPSTRDIEPAATLPPPIIGTDVPDSAPGVVQPQYKSGSATAPATPIPITGSPIIPPPVIGDPVGYPTFPPTGTGTAPVAVPIGPDVGPAVAAAAVPPSIAGQTQPQYKTGSATSPTAASLFPSLSAPGPSPPIILANTMQIGPGAPPFTAGTQPIIISNVAGIPQLPWNPGPAGLPLNTVKPAITYTPPLQFGTVLTCSTGTWSNSPTSYAYQWLRNGSPIATGANTPTYAIGVIDNRDMISCIVTAINTSGVASAEANAVGPAVEFVAAHEALAEYHEERAEHHEERAAHHGARAAHHGANKTKKKR